MAKHPRRAEPSSPIPLSQTLFLILDFRHYGSESSHGGALRHNMRSLCKTFSSTPEAHVLRTSNVIEGDIDVDATTTLASFSRNKKSKIGPRQDAVFSHINGDPCADPESTLLAYIHTHEIRRIIAAGLYTEVTFERLARGLDMWGSSSQADIARYGGNAAMASLFKWDPAYYGDTRAKLNKGKKRKRQDETGSFFDRTATGWDGQLIIVEDAIEPCQRPTYCLEHEDGGQTPMLKEEEEKEGQRGKDRAWRVEVHDRMVKMRRKLADYEFRGGFQWWTFEKTEWVAKEMGHLKALFRQSQRGRLEQFVRREDDHGSRNKSQNDRRGAVKVLDLTQNEISDYDPDTSFVTKTSARNVRSERENSEFDVQASPLEKQRQRGFRQERALNEAMRAAQEGVAETTALKPRGLRNGRSSKGNIVYRRSGEDSRRIGSGGQAAEDKSYDDERLLGEAKRLSKKAIQSAAESASVNSSTRLRR